MKIPKGPGKEAERWALYNELVNECLTSRQDRLGVYDRLRSYYLWGCDWTEEPAMYNKILPHIDLLLSFTFAAETTKFGVVLGESAGNERFVTKVPAISAMVTNKWHDSDFDIQFGQGILWSYVYNTMFVKMIQRDKHTIPYLVDPGSFGVLREDQPFLDDQEAFVHVYTIGYRSLGRILDAHPRKDLIMANVSRSLKNEDRDAPAGLSRIVMSSFPMTGTPSGPGTVQVPFTAQNAYRARIADERVEMKELWVWDDDENDYRIATLGAGNVCIFDRENFYLAGEHPFIQLCPNPDYGYFWGQSEVDRLTNLQALRERRMRQIVDLLDRQVKPPISQTGAWGGIPDEMAYAFDVFGGGAMTTDPTAKMEVHAPTVPPDTFTEIRMIDEMFNEASGLSNVTQGKGESGVRSKGHAAELARLGSARIRKRAFIIEDALDKSATHLFKLAQQHDDEIMEDEKGERFTAEQFTKDAVVKVDAHSSSPIFVEDTKQMLMEMFEAQAIDRAELIEGMDPPRKQVMLEKLKVREAKEAEAAKAQAAAEGAGGAGKKPPLAAAK